MDGTEESPSEKALVQSGSAEMARRLLATIAPRINNPLNAIQNLLHLARNSPSMEEVQTCLAAAELELQRAFEIVDSLR